MEYLRARVAKVENVMIQCEISACVGAIDKKY